MSVTLSGSLSDLRASQESNNEMTSSVEFVRLESFTLIPDYFAAPTPKIDSVEIELEGRDIKIYGISEEQQVQEFQSAFKQLFEPVVKNEDLKTVLDRFIIQELKNDLRKSKLNDLIGYLKIFTTPHLQPRELGLALRNLPGEDRQLFRTTLRFVDQREGLTNLPPYFTSLEKVKFALGEELYNRIAKKIPIKWKLAKEKVELLHGFIQSHIETLRETNWCEAAAGKIFAQFEKVQDHYLEDETLPYFIPILSPWLPRVEKVKQALRGYFEELDETALGRLENVCCGTELSVEFREMGETISLGGVNPGQHLFHHIHGAYSAEFSR